MQCPKCKSTIADNALRCPTCNLKVRFVCPECKSINKMGQKICKNCGFEIFKECSTCGAVNVYTAKYCRKCGEDLSIKPAEHVIAETLPEKTENTAIESIIESQQPEITESVQIKESEEEENIKNEVPDEILNADDGIIISSEDIDISEEQLKDLFDKVGEIEKNQERKAEVEAEIQRKFEQQDAVSSEEEEYLPPEYIQLNQKDAQTAIVDAIQNPLKRVISLNGKEGYGKSLIIKYVMEALRKENYVWALGECNALTQITPFGYLQDSLLNLFKLSNFSANIDDFISNNTKALEAQFFNLNPKEIQDLFNFLYPVRSADFNGILKRKEYTINILKKVFETLSMKSLIIFVIDDFENIDGASFDFLKNIISDEKFNEKIKILIINKYNKIAQGYFYNKELKQNNFANIFLSGLDKDQSLSLIDTLYGLNIHLPDNIENQIVQNSKGTSAYIEQACLFLNEMGIISSSDGVNIEFNHEYDDYELPNNTYKILEERLKLLEQNNLILVHALYYASLLGNKFSIQQFENVLQFFRISKEDFQQLCSILINANYLTVFSDNFLAFKNTIVWHYVYERAKTDEKFAEFNSNIYACIEHLTLSNNSLKPLLLQNFDNKKEAFMYWSKNSEYASYLGDTNLYVISLKQQLKIANDITDILSAQERINKYKKMGKILYKLSAKEAINYLSAAIAYYKESASYSPARIIELSAFLVQACKKTGNYLGVIEACDTAINALPDGEFIVEKALITSKKLNALLYIGNCEEIINLSNTELLIVMEEALAKQNISKIVSDTGIFEIWIDTSLCLASAYAIKGDKKCFEVLSKVDDALVTNKIDDVKSKRQILLTKALAHTMRGEVKLSSDILTAITSKYTTEEMEEEYILRWNLINIINKIISKDYKNLVDEMFQITTFADNIDDIFTKNILKLLLGYIIQTRSKNTAKALEIYNDEIVFFSKEKIATGALLCWYLIANASIITQGVDFALDIALKALDVAKGPKINNYLFIIILKRLIADIYMIKHDFEAAKMYLEKAMSIAQNNDLRYLQMLLYHSYAKYNEEMINIYKDNAQEYAQAAIDMYKSSLNLCQNLLLTPYENLIKKDLTSFKVACQLKNITVIVDED